MNTDGSYSGLSGIASCGDIARSHDGQFLAGVHLGAGMVTIFEPWGVLWALLLSRNLGYRQIVLKMDSSTVFGLIQQKVPSTHTYSSLIHTIQMFISDEWNVEICLIYREANRCADFGL